MFEALTGHVPFEREAPAARMYAHLTESPPTVSSLVPEGFRFDDVVTRALAKAPADRYPSAGDLGFVALAAAEDRTVIRTDRSVATGAAARLDITEEIDVRSAIKTVEFAALDPNRRTSTDSRSACSQAHARPDTRLPKTHRLRRAANRGSAAQRLVVTACHRCDCWRARRDPRSEWAVLIRPLDNGATTPGTVAAIF